MSLDTEIQMEARKQNDNSVIKISPYYPKYPAIKPKDHLKPLIKPKTIDFNVERYNAFYKTKEKSLYERLWIYFSNMFLCTGRKNNKMY